jgi:hypothetical protein
MDLGAAVRLLGYQSSICLVQPKWHWRDYLPNLHPAQGADSSEVSVADGAYTDP